MEAQELGSTQAIIYKIQTLTDGGIRLTLDLDDSSKELTKKLLDRKMMNKPLIQIGIVGINERW